MLETNKELNVQDNTAKGYCLPDSKSLSDEPINERLLNSTSFHIIRFFIHASMYWSCEKNEKVFKFNKSTHSLWNFLIFLNLQKGYTQHNDNQSR